MGTNILFEVNDSDLIEADHVNQYENALTVDLVPRNSAGSPTAEAGDLGNAATPWKALFLGAVSAGISIIESASKLIIKTANTDTVTIGTGGIEAGSYATGSIDTADIADSAIETAKINDQAVTPSKMGALTSAISGASGADTVISTSYAQILSRTITCTGNRPVLVFLTYGTLESPGTTSNIINNVFIELRRGSTALCNLRNDAASTPPVIYLDTNASSGVNTYSLHIRGDGGVGGYSDLKLQAVEL